MTIQRSIVDLSEVRGLALIATADVYRQVPDVTVQSIAPRILQLTRVVP